jgi:hypothetical protein
MLRTRTALTGGAEQVRHKNSHCSQDGNSSDGWL